MDVTPKVLREISFREKFRGYDPDEVDEFLGRVAETLKQMHGRLQEAAAQIEAAETRAARSEARSREGSETEETLRRTLVLAQRTADAAIEDAQQRAAEMLEVARAEADTAVSDARARAAVILEEAQSESLKLAEVRLDEVEAELGVLEGRRSAAQAEVAAAEARAEEARRRLAALVEDLQRLAGVAPRAVDAPASEPAAAPAPEADAAPEAGGPAGADEVVVDVEVLGDPADAAAPVAAGSDWWSAPAADGRADAAPATVVDVDFGAFVADDDGWDADEVDWSVEIVEDEPAPGEPVGGSWAPPPPPPPAHRAPGADAGAGPTTPPPPRPGADNSWAPPAVRAATGNRDDDEPAAPPLQLFGPDDRPPGRS